MARFRDSVPIRLRVVSGKQIPTALYAQLRRPLQRLFIVTPFLEDYEFFGRGPLSVFLSKQLSEGAGVTMLTMPPEGTNGTKSSFLRKYRLMHLFSTRGADVLFNRRLHAKVFLFDETEITKACILGSANLTTAAMNDRLEIAIFTYNRKLFDEVLAIVYKFMNDPTTMTFMQWKHREATKIRAIAEVE